MMMMMMMRMRMMVRMVHDVGGRVQAVRCAGAAVTAATAATVVAGGRRIVSGGSCCGRPRAVGSSCKRNETFKTEGDRAEGVMAAEIFRPLKLGESNV